MSFELIQFFCKLEFFTATNRGCSTLLMSQPLKTIEMWDQDENKSISQLVSENWKYVSSSERCLD